MKLSLPDRIDRKTWAAFLGMREEDLEEDSATGCEKLLFEAASPQGFFVYSDDMDYYGDAIKKHLAGCKKTVVMGMTLGRGVDELISKYEIKDMKTAVLADTGASVLADMVADIFEEEIREGLPKDTPFMTSRFSPGYGDLPLETQRKLISLLDAERKIGLTLNENDLMIPMKSVTAIMGVADIPVEGHLASCEECTLKENCTRRKEGKVCGRK